MDVPIALQQRSVTQSNKNNETQTSHIITSFRVGNCYVHKKNYLNTSALDFASRNLSTATCEAKRNVIKLSYLYLENLIEIFYKDFLLV